MRSVYLALALLVGIFKILRLRVLPLPDRVL